MSETEYIDDAMEMMGAGYDEPAAIIESPRKRRIMGAKPGLEEQETGAWIKLSTKFKDHIAELKGAPLAVWLYISLSINQSGVAFPGIATIAEKLGYSRQGVMDAIKVLEEKGYMTVRRGERKYNLYEPKFAANGRYKTPSDESTKLTRAPMSQVEDPDESTFSANESSGVDLNKNLTRDNKNGADAPRLTPENAVYVGQPVTAESLDDTHNRMVDTANLIATSMGAAAQPAYQLVMAFQTARGTVIPVGVVKGQRKAVKTMLESGVRPEHVTSAVHELEKAGMKTTDLFSVMKTAIDHANPSQSMPAPKKYYPAGLEVGF